MIVFPEWIIDQTVGSEVSSTSITQALNREHRVCVWAHDYQRISIQNATLTEKGMAEFRNFRNLVRGKQETFFARDRREYKLEDELLGIGNGTNKDFQVAIVKSIQGLPTYRIIEYPDHNNAPVYDSDGRLWRGTQQLTVTLNGATTTSWSLLDGGIIRFNVAPANGVQVRVSGTFLIKVRLNQDDIPARLMNGHYVISSDLALYEPVGKNILCADTDGSDALPIFPYWIIGNSVGGEYNFSREGQTTGNEAVIADEYDWQKVSVSDVSMLEKDHLQLRYLRRYLRGMFKCFLYMDRRESFARDQLIGVGNGITSQFPLKINRSYVGFGQSRERIISHPDHGMAALYDGYGRLMRPTQSIEIKVNGTPRVSGWYLDASKRLAFSSGVPTAGQQVTWSGYFYTKMRLGQDYIPVKIDGFNSGKGIYSCDEELSFVQPLGDK